SICTLLCEYQLMFSWYAPPPTLHSFPTRRSSDLALTAAQRVGSASRACAQAATTEVHQSSGSCSAHPGCGCSVLTSARPMAGMRSEEHTSELQSLAYLVCRLLLEKKKYEIYDTDS